MTEPSSPIAARRTPTLADFLPKRSAGLKLLLVIVLAALMTIPAMLIHGIVYERDSGLSVAIAEVSVTAGGQQSVLGPVLTVPYSRQVNPEKPDQTDYGLAVIFAETGTADSQVEVVEKRRGIHAIPVFEAKVDMRATFTLSELSNVIPDDAVPIWTDAKLFVGVSDTRGIKDAVQVDIDNRTIAMEPAVRVLNSNGYFDVPVSSLKLASGRIPDLEALNGTFDVRVGLRLGGAQRFSIGPFAKDTRVTMTSNWTSPSFQGGVLPDTHTAGESEAGFDATWRVPYMARGIPGSARNFDLNQITSRNHRDMAVHFIKEASPYQSLERALKYAAMFIGFVFLAYFSFETTSKHRAHPAQYFLVGLAQAMFYMLLLAFSERIGFDWAFLIASTMTVSLTALYAMNVFNARSYGLRAFGILGGIYGLIYVLMRAESQALLAGALASFTAIALTMYMTRNVDWYGERSTAASV